MNPFREQINICSEENAQKKWSSVNVAVVLGNPRSGCTGTGICKLELLSNSTSNKYRPCKAVVAVMRLLNDKRLKLTISKDELNDCTRRHFIDNRLVIPHRVCLPDSVVSIWHLASLHISTGIYQLDEFPEHLSLELKLEKTDPAQGRQSHPEDAPITSNKYGVEKP